MCQYWTRERSAQAGSDEAIREYRSTRTGGHRFLVGPSLLLRKKGTKGNGLYYAGTLGGELDLYTGQHIGRVEGTTLDEIVTECDWHHACNVMLHRDGRDGYAPNEYCIIVRRRGWSEEDAAATPGWRLVDMRGQGRDAELSATPASPFAYLNSSHGTGARARLAIDPAGDVIATPSAIGEGGAPTITGDPLALAEATELVWSYDHRHRGCPRAASPKSTNPPGRGAERSRRGA